MGLIFAYSITGAVLVEIVFVWPGLGSYMVDAILNSDIYVLFAVTLVVTIIYVIINIVVDSVQASLDPRIRLGGGQEG
jgi:peptide/nickel transport system permease protein